MSSFSCDKCGFLCVDTSIGYITGCEHYPADNQKFSVGDRVYIPVYNDDGNPGEAVGTIKSIAPSFSEVLKYEIHGDNLVSIVSENSIRHAG